MMKWILVAAIAFPSAIVAGCSESNGGDEMIACGAGSGYRVPFCAEVANYDAGFGIAGVDEIAVDCIAGPRGAGVFESPNGTYFVAGTYRLGSFDRASIELNWGGSTSYSSYVGYTIPAPGEGAFAVSVSKTEGGDGNMFLSMASGSMWMFDLIPINEGCGTSFQTSPLSTRVTAPGAERPRRYGPRGESRPAGER